MKNDLIIPIVSSVIISVMFAINSGLGFNPPTQPAGENNPVFSIPTPGPVGPVGPVGDAGQAGTQGPVGPNPSVGGVISSNACVDATGTGCSVTANRPTGGGIVTGASCSAAGPGEPLVNTTNLTGTSITCLCKGQAGAVCWAAIISTP